MRHGWPGNVRELENVAQRLIALPRVEAADLGLPPSVDRDPAAWEEPPRPDGAGRIDYRRVMESADRRLIQWALQKASGRVSAAAELLELPRSTLRSKIEKYGLDSTDD